MVGAATVGAATVDSTELEEFAADTFVKLTALQPLKTKMRRPALPRVFARQEMRWTFVEMAILDL
jgi:hypothetical protein